MTSDPTLFVGTYTDEESDGIYGCRASDAGGLEGVELAAQTPDPSFLAAHPSGEYLYAVNEIESGRVSAFSIEGDGDLAALNSVSSGAAGPCHVSVDATGSDLVVSNYAGGAVAVVPIEGDGSLEEPSQVIDREGSSADPDRQEASHVHSATPGPDNEVVYVADLGTDELLVYELNLAEDRLENPTAIDIEPGAGPRHVAVSPDASTVYLLCELDNTLRTFDRSSDGSLREVDVVETLPDDWTGESYTAEVRVHQSGAYAFVSNRGHDSIAGFELDDDGRPSLLGHTDSGGEWPRHFTITPDGERMIVANQFTDTIASYEIDRATGELRHTDTETAVSQPVCLKFYR